jgi:hypothetical protein
MRETAEEKAGRLLTTGRVHVVRVGPQGVRATVDGDTGIRDVTFDGRWRCNCPSFAPCSHAIHTSKVVPR